MSFGYGGRRHRTGATPRAGTGVVRRVARLALAAMLAAALVPGGLLTPAHAGAQQGPPPAVRRALDRVVEMLSSQGDEALRVFADSALAPAYRQSFSEPELMEHLRRVRTHGAGHGGGNVFANQEEGGTLLLTVGGAGGPRFRLRLDDGNLLTLLEVADQEGGNETGGPARAGPPASRDEAVRAHVRALEGMARMTPETARDALVRDHLAPSFMARTDPDALAALVALLRKASASAQDVRLNEDDQGFLLALEGVSGARVRFRLEDAPPFRMTELSAQEVRGGPLQASDVEPIEWDALGPRLQEAAQEEFSGVVLARRGGETVLDETYGAADRASGRSVRRNTVFGIGSTPIDFTVTGALLLAQRGQLSLSDSIGRFLEGVPADKAGMTLDMILAGRSGLPDFHDTPDDWDPDLAWIDRDTAVRRILAQPLLFPPGTDQAHSHAAYVLLAAILEEASGQPYRDFVRSQILEPLGMARTGFYGESLGLTEDDFAVGYGVSSVGVPNIPPNWGPTSWLVMGSGGMFSTLEDMRRYYDGLRDGALLQGEWASRYQGPRVGVGGSERGFFFLHVANGQGDDVILLMNGGGRAPETERLTQGLIGMVMGPR